MKHIISLIEFTPFSHKMRWCVFLYKNGIDKKLHMAKVLFLLLKIFKVGEVLCLENGEYLNLLQFMVRYWEK